jgi:hypothetical protein
MRVDTITLWLGEKCVIVEPGSSADKLFRAKGYAEKATNAVIGKSKYKRGRSKKVKAGGN